MTTEQFIVLSKYLHSISYSLINLQYTKPLTKESVALAFKNHKEARKAYFELFNREEQLLNIPALDPLA